MSYDVPSVIFAPPEKLDLLRGDRGLYGEYSFENLLPTPGPVRKFFADGGTALSDEALEWRTREWGNADDIMQAERVSATELQIVTYWSLPMKAMSALLGSTVETACVHRVVRGDPDLSLTVFGFDGDAWREPRKDSNWEWWEAEARREFAQLYAR
ncbi:hypothetical protein [Microbacterium sp. XT11]|uniref:hypothetical protein n=1 Tax=Microbacterium sp. XT11 TaxID=367477 RepID=UPI0008379765|nr:hypothetical protein [Microbacterium sp. XT11]